jgi:hypothetical protein
MTLRAPGAAVAAGVQTNLGYGVTVDALVPSVQRPMVDAAAWAARTRGAGRGVQTPRIGAPRRVHATTRHGTVPFPAGQLGLCQTSDVAVPSGCSVMSAVAGQSAQADVKPMILHGRPSARAVAVAASMTAATAAVLRRWRAAFCWRRASVRRCWREGVISYLWSVFDGLKKAQKML